MKRNRFIALIAVLCVSCSAASLVFAGGSKESVKLLFGVWGADVKTNAGDFYSTATEWLKSHPNVTIEWNGVEHDEFYKQMDAMVGAGDIVYDIVWQTTSGAQQYAKKGVFADITPYVDAEWKSCMLPDAWNATTFDGKTYGTPLLTGFQGWFFNKAMFDTYNLKLPDAWDEWVTAFKTFKANGVTPISFAAKQNPFVWGFMHWPYRYGWADLLTPVAMDTTMKFNNPQMLKLWKRYEEVGSLGAIDYENAVNVDYDQMLDAFLTGKNPIITGGSWMLAQMQNSAIANDIRFSYGPKFPDGIADQKIGNRYIDGGYFVSKKAGADKNKIAAIIDLFKYRSSPAGSRIQAEQGFLPASKVPSDINASALQKYIGSVLNDGTRASGIFEVGLGNNTEAEMISAFYNSFHEVIAGRKTAEQALDDLDKVMEKYRKK